MEGNAPGPRYQKITGPLLKSSVWMVPRYRAHFTARPAGKVNSDEKSRNNNKRASRGKKARIWDALGAKTADKNLTTEWRPDYSNSLSSQAFLHGKRDRESRRGGRHINGGRERWSSLLPSLSTHTHTHSSPPFRFTALKLFALCF